jgi:tRNA A-37 threonylcarbamoyl transferase component Bud32
MPRFSRLRAERIGGFTWTLREDCPPTWWRAVLSDPDVWLRDPAWHLKNSRNVTLARVTPPDTQSQPLVLRRINYGRWRQRLRDCFRPSRAHRAFRAALALESAGLPVARALAVAVWRRWRWPVRAYLVSTEIENARTLRQLAGDPEGLSRRLMDELAGLLARWHNAGFVHGDLKATNILVQPSGKIWLIDFDGVRRFQRVPETRAVQDLTRLLTGIIEAGGHPSFLRQARFVRRYCEERQLEDWRTWHDRVLYSQTGAAPGILGRDMGKRPLRTGSG